jgi:hypothetical protein
MDCQLFTVKITGKITAKITGIQLTVVKNICQIKTLTSI